MHEPPKQPLLSEVDLSKETSVSERTNTLDPTALSVPRKSQKIRKGDVRVASINLTTPGYESLGTLVKRTGLSRKEVVSRALVNALNGTMNEIIVKFKFMEPLLLTELRKDIISFEASAESIREGLYSIRPRDPKQADKIALELDRIQELLRGAEKITEEIKKKHRLLLGLTAADHKALPELLPWLDRVRKGAKGSPQEAQKLVRFDLIERLVRLSV